MINTMNVSTVLFLFYFISVCDYSSADEIVSNMTIRLPGAISNWPDSLMCTSKRLPKEESYIIKFEPHATKKVAHHLMVYGCSRPASSKPLWNCYSNRDSIDDENAVCSGRERQIIFAWALDAPDKNLPEGVGFRVSGDTGIDYIVIQLHYAFAFTGSMKDYSGMTLQMTTKRPPQQAGYIVLGNFGFIPPQMKDYHMESSCRYMRNYTVYPIGYRTHAHNLGYVTSGYRIRDGKWTEIGRMSPQLPQTFYEVSNPGMDIKNGDILAARCTMNSMARKTNTAIGPHNRDEMCNFYIMYSTYHQEPLELSYCFDDARSYHWRDDLNNIPADASSLDGIKHTDIVEEKFKIN